MSKLGLARELAALLRDVLIAVCLLVLLVFGLNVLREATKPEPLPAYCSAQDARASAPACEREG